MELREPAPVSAADVEWVGFLPRLRETGLPIAQMRGHAMRAPEALTAKSAPSREDLAALRAHRQQWFERRKTVLDGVDGEASARRHLAELAHQVVARGFGEISSRLGLEPRDR